MTFNPPAVANAAANQYLDDESAAAVANGGGVVVTSAEENTGRAMKRFKATVTLNSDHRRDSISTTELGQQAAFFVQQASLAIPGVGNNKNNNDDAVVPAWALAMQAAITNNHNIVTAKITTLTTNVTTLTAKVTALTDNVTTLTDKVTNLTDNHNNMMIRMANSDARAVNGYVVEQDNVIAVITNDQGEPPANFPETLRAFHKLTTLQTQGMLQFYGLPVNTDDDEEIITDTVRLRRHFGIRTASA